MEYNVIPTTEIYDNFKCPLCLNFMEKTISLSCTHTYCEACITKFIKVSDDSIRTEEYWGTGTPDYKCPSCRKTFTISEISPMPTLDRYIKNITFQCEFKCEKVISFNEMRKNSHICDNVRICPNHRCNERIHKDKVNEHIKNCAFTVRKCQVCLEPFYNGDFKIHLPQCFANYGTLHYNLCSKEELEK